MPLPHHLDQVRRNRDEIGAQVLWPRTETPSAMLPGRPLESFGGQSRERNLSPLDARDQMCGPAQVADHCLAAMAAVLQKCGERFQVWKKSTGVDTPKYGRAATEVLERWSPALPPGKGVPEKLIERGCAVVGDRYRTRVMRSTPPGWRPSLAAKSA